MLTEEQEKELKQICVLLQCKDPESRKLGKSLLKEYHLDNMYIIFGKNDWPSYKEKRKVLAFKSAEKYIIILNNLSKKSGSIRCKNGDILHFPVWIPVYQTLEKE